MGDVVEIPKALEENRELKVLTSAVLARYQFARQAGITFGGLRDLYEVLGSNRLITNRQYRETYERGGIAGRIVEALPKAAWRGEMWIEEDENPDNITPLEKAWDDLDLKHHISSTLLRADILSQLSTYSILLIGAPGNLEQPLPKGGKLLYLQPFAGGGGPSLSSSTGRRSGNLDADATIYRIETDFTSARYGLPKTYTIRRQDVSTSILNRKIHWSRVLHLAERRLDNEVYGSPVLERVWNLIVDLDKVTGGGAEAFWMRANQGMHLDVDKDMKLSDAEREALKEQADDYQHQLRRTMRTRGVDINMLGSDVANFANPADAILTQIAGALGIPKRILTGSEMGELASSQDRENWRDQIIGRQGSYAGPHIVRPLVNRLIEHGFLPTPKEGPGAYKVQWPHIQVLTETEKASGAGQWAGVNATQGGIVFTNDEIREKWYGLKPLDDAQKVSPQRAAAQAQAQAPPPPGKQTFGEVPAPLVKAAEAELIRVLSAAVEAGNQSVIDRILGDYKFSSTQVQLPLELAVKLQQIALGIPADAFTDVEGEKHVEHDSHITVKYGIHTEDPDEVREALNGARSVSGTLGPLKVFETDKYDVLYASVKSLDLVKLNALISADLECTDTQPTYTPHATIAYLKPGRGKAFVGRTDVAGQTFTARSVMFCMKSGAKTELELV